MRLDRLFEEATQMPPAGRPATVVLSPIQDAPVRMQSLLNAELPALLASMVALEKQRYTAYRVDGNIIGTGAADFTTGNTCYTLKHGVDKVFQLFDVPGIEGDESRFAAMVKAAVAKAHLVVYVNGTNKKPEKTTAEKIRSYLNRGTQVSPIINVRGSADAYEFEEDRVSLANHGNCEKALGQTEQVLRSVLGDDVLLPGHCVQGLLGFSSLAMRGEESTIHPSRVHDLGIQQRNYLKHFGSARTMYEFSQLQQIAGVLHAKLGTFRQDIIESNKTKVRELLVENIGILDKMRDEHRAFLAKVEPEFDKCRVAVGGALATFDRVLAAGRKNLWNKFFNDLSERADEIVKEHFGDNDRISSEIDKGFRRNQKQTEEMLQAQLEEQMTMLQESLAQATQRLVEDVRRVDFQQRVRVAGHDSALRYKQAKLDMDLSLADWRSIVLNIGSYAIGGATIGSPFSFIGMAIGAAVGAVLGAIVSAFEFLVGKERRIRKAQSQVQEKIDEVRNRIIDGLPSEQKSLTDSVRDEVNRGVLGWVDAMHASLVRPLEVIESQIVLMTKTKDQLAKMPYGTIHPIRY